MSDQDAVRRLEEEIADLKGRWPAHSAPPALWARLEHLESELEKARSDDTSKEDGGREAGLGRLPQV